MSNTITAELNATTDRSAATPFPALETLIDRLATAAFQQTEAAREAVHASTAHRTQSSLFVFSMGGTRYALPMLHVVDVQRLPTWTRLPNVSSWVLGVTNLRGEIVSVIDPLRFLNLPSANDPVRQSHKLIVLRLLDQDLQIGLSVEQVIGLRTIDAVAIQPPTGMLREHIATYLTGTCEIDSQLVLVLHAERLLKSLAAPFESH